MLSNAVSLVQITLLSPEFFASEEQIKSMFEALICDYFGPELISGLISLGGSFKLFRNFWTLGHTITLQQMVEITP